MLKQLFIVLVAFFTLISTSFARFDLKPMEETVIKDTVKFHLDKERHHNYIAKDLVSLYYSTAEGEEKLAVPVLEAFMGKYGLSKKKQSFEEKFKTETFRKSCALFFDFIVYFTMQSEYTDNFSGLSAIQKAIDNLGGLKEVQKDEDQLKQLAAIVFWNRKADYDFLKEKTYESEDQSFTKPAHEKSFWEFLTSKENYIRARDKLNDETIDWLINYYKDSWFKNKETVDEYFGKYSEIYDPLKNYLFDWFALKPYRESNALTYEARMDSKKLKDDIVFPATKEFSLTFNEDNKRKKITIQDPMITQIDEPSKKHFKYYEIKIRKPRPVNNPGEGRCGYHTLYAFDKGIKKDSHWKEKINLKEKDSDIKIHNRSKEFCSNLVLEESTPLIRYLVAQDAMLNVEYKGIKEEKKKDKESSWHEFKAKGGNSTYNFNVPIRLNFNKNPSLENYYNEEFTKFYTEAYVKNSNIWIDKTGYFFRIFALQGNWNHIFITKINTQSTPPHLLKIDSYFHSGPSSSAHLINPESRMKKRQLLQVLEANVDGKGIIKGNHYTHILGNITLAETKIDDTKVYSMGEKTNILEPTYRLLNAENGNYYLTDPLLISEKGQMYKFNFFKSLYSEAEKQFGFMEKKKTEIDSKITDIYKFLDSQKGIFDEQSKQFKIDIENVLKNFNDNLNNEEDIFHRINLVWYEDDLRRILDKLPEKLDEDQQIGFIQIKEVAEKTLNEINPINEKKGLFVEKIPEIKEKLDQAFKLIKPTLLDYIKTLVISKGGTIEEIKNRPLRKLDFK